MRLQTKYFGEIDCPEEDLLHFPEGLFGFEEEKEFFLLPFEDSEGTLLCFQSAARTCASIPCAWCAGRWRTAR